MQTESEYRATFSTEEISVSIITDRAHQIVFGICEQKFRLLMLRNVEQVGSNVGVK
jgi:hypothetical protein